MFLQISLAIILAIYVHLYIDKKLVILMLQLDKMVHLHYYQLLYKMYHQNQITMKSSELHLISYKMEYKFQYIHDLLKIQDLYFKLLLLVLIQDPSRNILYDQKFSTLFQIQFHLFSLKDHNDQTFCHP